MSIRYIGFGPAFPKPPLPTFVFLSGMVPENGSADATEQTRDVLAQIDHWLAQCRSDKNHLLEATIFWPTWLTTTR